eukprot:TRINITY_DN66866_c6_g2_i1.p1 TRINITY_DN66866_c6_g2~~TRINITY_DN66866_c6_g2_i1.p1  ORF type:complete len:172 (+),score=20.56 TRINITY_DN66866_c6_g2_i1:36-518(+)
MTSQGAKLTEEQQQFLQVAIDEAKKGLSEGGIPIGSALVMDGKVVAKGHNKRVQEKDPILHGEMDCLKNAGRLKSSEYRRCTLYSTLSPCWMCTGTSIMMKIPRVIVAEDVNFQGPADVMRQNGIEVVVVENQECIDMMKKWIDENPELWNEDISELDAK